MECVQCTYMRCNFCTELAILFWCFIFDTFIIFKYNYLTSEILNPLCDIASMQSADWSIEGKPEVLEIRNKLREVVEKMKFELCPDKELIELTLGDPTCCGILPPHPDALLAVSEAVMSGVHNGYKVSKGSVEARQAVADKYSTQESPLTAGDVYLTHGCSGEFSRTRLAFTQTC